MAMERDAAARKLQGLFRTRKARVQLRKLLQQTVEMVYDEHSGAHFYFNTKTGESSWELPRLLQQQGAAVEVLTPRARLRLQRQEEKRRAGKLKSAADMTEDEAARFIQNLYRTRRSRQHLSALLASVYQKSYDEEGNAFYYNSKTGESSWEKPRLLGAGDLDDGMGDYGYGDDYSHAYGTGEGGAPSEGPSDSGGSGFGKEGKIGLETQEELAERGRAKLEAGAREVAAFLRHFKLENLLDALLDEGFDDMDAVTAMQESDIDELGIKKRYREPLFSAVIEYRRLHDIVDPFEGEVDSDDMDQDGDSRAGSEGTNQREEGEYEEEEERGSDDEGKLGQDEGRGDGGAGSWHSGDEDDEYSDEYSESEDLAGVEINSVFAGDGRHFPRRGQFALVHYVASLEDGTIFESSRKRGRPFDFLVGAGHVIPGLDRAIRHLSRGERATVIVDPDLAYGERGRPPVVPPNATLRFEIELIDSYHAPVGELLDDEEASFSAESEVSLADDLEEQLDQQGEEEEAIAAAQ